MIRFLRDWGVAIAFCCAHGLCVPNCSAGDEDKAILGEWRIVQEERSMTRTMRTEAVRWRIDKDVIFMKGDDMEVIAKYDLYRDKKPQQIEIKYEYEGDSYTMRGIYRLREGKLELCWRGDFARFAPDAPREFATDKKDDTIFMTTLEKVD